VKIVQVYDYKSLKKEVQKHHFKSTGVTYDLSYYVDNYIPDSCFAENTNLQKIIASDRLQTIGKTAFTYCINLDFVDSAVSTVGQMAFYNCCKLRHFNFNNITFIDSTAFENCGLKSVRLDKCPIIYSRAFADCFSLKKVSLKGVQKIYEEAFVNAAIETLIIPKSVNEIKAWAFKNNTFLRNVVILNPDIKIDNHAFDGCSIRNVWVNESSDARTLLNAFPKGIRNDIKVYNAINDSISQLFDIINL
jgi:hypothetical protein